MVAGAAAACCTTTFSAAAAGKPFAQKRERQASGASARSAEESRPRVWYGWQTLVVDAVSTALVFAAVEGDTAVPAVFAAGGYVLGGPLIHVGNDQYLNGLGSLGLRLTLPTIGGVIGAQAGDDGCGDWVCFHVAYYGFFIGLGAAVLLDAAVFGYRSVDEEVVATPRLQPTFAIGRDGGVLGIAGRF